MKKFSLIISLFILFSFSACNIIPNGSKPGKDYYTKELCKGLSKNINCSAKILDTNFYKEIPLENENMQTLNDFFQDVKKVNYIDMPSDLPKKPLYKIFVTANKQKYVINVYSEKYISVFPWDGKYPMDYLTMKGIHVNNNLYGLCKHLIPSI